MANKRNINMDIVKRDAAERRKEDIELHGKPTAFRPTKTKNKKAYTRKEKHKIGLCEEDIKTMVFEAVKLISESEISDLIDKNFESEVVSVCKDINEYLQQFGLKAKFNKKYDFSGVYANSVAIYQYRSVKSGCMRISVNINSLKEWAEEDDFVTYEDIADQIKISLWHECAHGLIEWIKQQRRIDTQQGTKIFTGEKLKALRWLLGFDEEDLCEEFGERMAFYSGHSDLLDFINDYMK